MKEFDDKGYITIYLPEHPNAKTNGCISLHRYLMSQKLGRKLLRTEHVHHIDGNIKNNELTNLELLTSSQHTHAHKGTKPAYECVVCGKVTTNKIACSNKCSSIHQRKCDRPSIELLNKLLKEYSYVAVGKMFGVSDNAIRKWLKEVSSNG